MSQCLLRTCSDNHSTPFRQSLSWGWSKGRLCATSFLDVLQSLFFYACQSTEQPRFAAASLNFSSAAWALFKGLSVSNICSAASFVWFYRLDVTAPSAVPSAGPKMHYSAGGLPQVPESMLRYYNRQMWAVLKGVFLMCIAYFSCSDIVGKEVVTYCFKWRKYVK